MKSNCHSTVPKVILQFHMPSRGYSYKDTGQHMLTGLQQGPGKGQILHSRCVCGTQAIGCRSTQNYLHSLILNQTATWECSHAHRPGAALSTELIFSRIFATLKNTAFPKPQADIFAHLPITVIQNCGAHSDIALSSRSPVGHLPSPNPSSKRSTPIAESLLAVKPTAKTSQLFK